MSGEIEVGARVEWEGITDGQTFAVLYANGQYACIESETTHSGTLFAVPVKNLRLTPDTLMVELPRSTVEIFAGVIRGGVGGLAENEKLAVACRKALVRGGVSE
jgi:hypothetical protein